MSRAFLKILALLVATFGIAMQPPAAVSWYYANGHLLQYAAIAACALALGGAGMFLSPTAERVLRTRDGFLIVALSWTVMSLLGGIPFVLIGASIR